MNLWMKSMIKPNKPILYDISLAAYEWLEAYSEARKACGDSECARVERENLRQALGLNKPVKNVREIVKK